MTTYWTASQKTFNKWDFHSGQLPEQETTHQHARIYRPIDKLSDTHISNKRVHKQHVQTEVWCASRLDNAQLSLRGTERRQTIAYHK